LAERFGTVPVLIGSAVSLLFLGLAFAAARRAKLRS
jgi:hypothetical protein